MHLPHRALRQHLVLVLVLYGMLAIGNGYMVAIYGVVVTGNASGKAITGHPTIGIVVVDSGVEFLASGVK